MRVIVSESARRTSSLVVRVALIVVLLAAMGGLPSPAPTSAARLTNVSAVVSFSGGINLRRSPAWSGSVIKVLPNGARIAVIGTNGDWFKVTATGSTGYVNSWYTTLQGTPSRVIRRGNTSRKMVALTFDAGSDLGYTETIIGTLEAKAIHATFSLTGDWMRFYPDYAAWIAADGFQIMNHTLNHPSYTGYSVGGDPISPARRLSQLEANETRLRGVTGVSSKPYWRPPYGDCDDGVLVDVGADGYSTTVLWTVDTMGWDGASADQIVNRVVGNAANGMIVLMHVGAASQDGVALPRVIAGLRAKGYRFGTVAEAIAT
jgi:peptidoglycan/xylan/chitin deacetylase (PgdA/CDA1 family)